MIADSSSDMEQTGLQEQTNSPRGIRHFQKPTKRYEDVIIIEDSTDNIMESATPITKKTNELADEFKEMIEKLVDEKVEVKLNGFLNELKSKLPKMIVDLIDVKKEKPKEKMQVAEEKPKKRNFSRASESPRSL